MTKTRKTIGVMVGGITDDFTRFLCKGLREAAKEQDVNMVVLPGKFLDRDYAQNTDIMYEYQYDTLFSSVQKGRLDGIIVAANCIGCYTTKERMVEFMHHYDGIPCVLVSSDLEGYVNVSYDNDRGIRQGIDYLVQDLHYTKIGMEVSYSIVSRSSVRTTFPTYSAMIASYPGIALSVSLSTERTAEFTLYAYTLS